MQEWEFGNRATGVRGRLSLVDLNQELSGYRQFLSCWVWQDDDLCFLVDPGPVSSIPHLLEQLDALGVRRLDYVLLTHIHLDHGGGTAQVLERFPQARVHCHPIGVKHVVDPGRLWQGSLKVLGELARHYGQPRPVPAESMADADELAQHSIEVVPTPGHAPHHVSFLFGDVLFAGEAIGTRIPLPSGKPYLRPATPPRFFLDQALASHRRLRELSPQPRHTALAHYGLVGAPAVWCERAGRQLEQWVEQVRELLKESPDNLEPRLFERLMQVDPLYGQGNFESLDDDLKRRERRFVSNTLAGIMGYLDSPS
jgi:glyoxylase-like metal-dependent hydrolase (beta-lactamase superfamily II)